MPVQRLVVAAHQVQGKTLTLTAEQQHYLLRVLRLVVGDRFLALDGEGGLWLATIVDSANGHTTATLTSPPGDVAAVRSLHRPTITLAAGLPKQGFDEVVRQVTELGVDRIVPILSDRTLLKPSSNKLQRWQRIASEAAEQSERLTVPTVSDPLSWHTWLQQAGAQYRCICVARREAMSLLTACLTQPEADWVIAIGPEGGWTDQEVTAAIAAGYTPVSLGNGILRSVTACVTALSILHMGVDFATIEPHQVM